MAHIKYFYQYIVSILGAFIIGIIHYQRTKKQVIIRHSDILHKQHRYRAAKTYGYQSSLAISLVHVHLVMVHLHFFIGIVLKPWRHISRYQQLATMCDDITVVGSPRIRSASLPQILTSSGDQQS
jgi:hypothetical protein